MVAVLLRVLQWLTRAWCCLACASENFGGSSILGSIHALVASPYKSAYVVRSTGSWLQQVIALETADREITINTVCPATEDAAGRH